MKKSLIFLLLAYCYTASAAEDAAKSERPISLQLYVDKGRVRINCDTFWEQMYPATCYQDDAEDLLCDHWYTPDLLEKAARLMTVSNYSFQNIALPKDVDAAGLTSSQIAGLKLLQLGEDTITKRQKGYQDQIQELPELFEATKQRITQELEQLGSKSLENYRKRTRSIIERWAIQQSIAEQRRPITQAYKVSSAICLVGAALACSGLDAVGVSALCVAAGAYRCTRSCIIDNNNNYDATLETAIQNQPIAATMLRKYESNKDK